MASWAAVNVLSQHPVHRSPSIRSAVLGSLNTLCHFSASRSKLQKPDLYHFMSGIFNDLSNSHFIFTKFQTALVLVLLKDSGSELPQALSFLIQAAKSQQKLFKKLVFGNTTFKNNQLLQALKIIVRRTSTQSGFYSDPTILRAVRVKISALLFMLLKDDGLPRRMQMKLWEEFFNDAFRFALEEFSAASESTGEPINSILKNLSEWIRQIQESERR